MTLAAECALALCVFLVLIGREEDFYFSGGGTFLGLILGALLFVGVAGVVSLTGSAVVLPLVWLSRRWARRAGRADSTMRCLAVCVLAAAVAGAGAGAVWALLGGEGTALLFVAPAVFVVLTPPALCARAVTAVRRTGVRLAVPAVVAIAGAALSAVVIAGGVVAYATGLLELYQPPRLTQEQLVGTWTDDRGGTLTLRADGTAVAENLGVDGRCSDSGTWEREEGTQDDLQLDLRSDDCLTGTYEFAGTEERPSLFEWVGELDMYDRYILRRT
ncbi:hypothetical protein [Streptomyces sp. NPDC055058]